MMAKIFLILLFKLAPSFNLKLKRTLGDYLDLGTYKKSLPKPTLGGNLDWRLIESWAIFWSFTAHDLSENFLP